MLRRIGDALVPGNRRRGRQKTRWWKDSCKRDIESVELKEDDVLVRQNGREMYSDQFRRSWLMGKDREGKGYTALHFIYTK